MIKCLLLSNPENRCSILQTKEFEWFYGRKYENLLTYTLMPIINDHIFDPKILLNISACGIDTQNIEQNRKKDQIDPDTIFY
jgi:hypothetical protein